MRSNCVKELSDSLDVVVLRTNEGYGALPGILTHTTHSINRLADILKVAVSSSPANIEFAYINFQVQVLIECLSEPCSLLLLLKYEVCLYFLFL